MSNSQLNKLKCWIKNGTELTLETFDCDSNDGNNFSHKMLLTNTQISNGSSANIKLSKTQLQKIGQPGKFLSRLLGPLLKSGLPLIGDVLKPLAKSVLIRLGLTAVASAIDTSIYKKMFGSGVTTLTILNEEMNDIMKIIKSLEESGLLITGVSQKMKNVTKEQERGFLGMLLGTLGVSLLGNLSTGKGTVRAGKSTIRAGQDF